MLVASDYVAISDRADISLAASLIGMLGSRMIEHRTSLQIMGAVPPSAPCSFCGKGVAQTTAHCLTSGACTKFQQDKMDRHDEIVLKLVRFLRTRTAYFHIASRLGCQPVDVQVQCVH